MPAPVDAYRGRRRATFLVYPVGCLFACFAGFVAAETITLGGPRDVVVEVDDVRGGFNVLVEMRPVSCFNEATNARVNRSKACLYGLVGLARSLEIDTDRLAVGSAVSGVEVDAVAPDAGRYRLRFFVPETAFSRQADPAAGPVNAPPAAAPSASPRSRSQLFTCVDDYAMTVTELKTTYNERLQSLEQSLANAPTGTGPAEHLDSMRVALAAMNAEIEAAFRAVEQEFRDDLRVLSVEKEALSAELKKSRTELEAVSTKASAALTALASRVSSASPPASSAPPPIAPATPK